MVWIYLLRLQSLQVNKKRGETPHNTKEYIMTTVKTNIRTFKSRAKCAAYMTRFTATAKRLGMIPHYSISMNGREIVITLTARPSDVTPCANAMRPLCKDKTELINTVHSCFYDVGVNMKTVIHGVNGFNMYHSKPRAYATPYSRLIISHLI